MPLGRLKAWPFCRFASWVTPFCTPLPHPSDEITDEIRSLVSDMFETMDAAPGVGLAAPQVGVPLRIFTYSYPDDDGAPWRGVIINPELWMTPARAGRPRPGRRVRGLPVVSGRAVPAAAIRAVLVTGTDLEGAPVRIEVDGWRARILQHEFDHLDGILYVDRPRTTGLEDGAEDRPQTRLGASRAVVDARRGRHRGLSRQEMKNGPGVES